MFFKSLRHSSVLGLSAAVLLAGSAYAGDLKSDLIVGNSGNQQDKDLGSAIVGGTSSSFTNHLWVNGGGVTFPVTFSVDTKPSFVTSVGGGTITAGGDDNAQESLIAYTVPCELGAFGGRVQYAAQDATPATGDPVGVSTAWVDVHGIVTSLGSNCSTPFTVTGFYRPVDMGITNSAKAGQTIPLKFNIWDGTDAVADTAEVAAFVQKVQCTETSGVVDAIEDYSAGSTVLRWDSIAGQFVFNWQTKKAWAGSCYRVTMTATGGAEISADFLLK